MEDLFYFLLVEKSGVNTGYIWRRELMTEDDARTRNYDMRCMQWEKDPNQNMV